MQQFDGDYVDKLNRLHRGGKFLKTAIVWEEYDPLTQTFWVDHEEPVVYDGNTYTPLHMRWDGIKNSLAMPTQGSEIALSNIGNQVVKYVKQLDITGNDIVIALLHLDLLGSLQKHWKRRYKILTVNADREVAVFTVGRQLGRSRLPRNIITRSRYPGIDSRVARIL